MKKIFKQLMKLFGSPIVVRHTMANYGTTFTDTYSVYIGSSKVFPHNWSRDFKTLKELDEYLDKRIEKYKKVYNERKTNNESTKVNRTSKR